MSTLYFCCDERRRQAVLDHPTLNGIDFLEVAPDEMTLALHFLKDLDSAAIGADDLRIDGGESIRVAVASVAPGNSPRSLRVMADRAGDFSTYTLRLRQGGAQDITFDPVLSAVDFSFKINCDSPADCLPSETCQPAPLHDPQISYLAKDYASFRQLMLDRLSVLMPEWRDRNPADMGIALVEVLAYVGDYLSYRQDAIATEAYLGTARLRTSVRRHARLVDYPMHDGCNARTWAQVLVDVPLTLPQRTPLLTHVPDQGPLIAPGSPDERAALARETVVFETMHAAALYPQHNRIDFYTWGDDRCCLPQGATRASLRDPGGQLRLAPGDVLILEEVRGAETGVPEDADRAHRHAVRLTVVEPMIDPLYTEVDPQNPDAPPAPIRVLNVTWAAADALPFALCLYEVVDSERGGVYPVSVALGNMVLADHGRSVQEPIGTVRARTLLGGDDGRDQDSTMSGRCGDRQRRVVLLTLAGSAELRSELDRGTLPAALRDALDVDQSLGDVTVTPIEAGRGWTITTARQTYVVNGVGDKLRVYQQTSAVAARFRPRLGQPHLTHAAPYQTVLFTVDGSPHVRADLDGGSLPDSLRREFAARDIALPDLTVTPSDPGRRWAVIARAATYVVMAVEGKLQVHDFPAAQATIRSDVREAQPRITLTSTLNTVALQWQPRRDLLDSAASDPSFVVEVESDGATFIRFGDDTYGLRPAVGASFTAAYRVGNGAPGNIGADALGHIVSGVFGLAGVRNPLPARGGVAPESIAQVRQNAPVAFRTNERAVTPDDYARMAERHPEVQRAAATFRWTGSWYTVFITADRVGGLPVDQEFERRLRRHMERFRMAGYDIEIDGPRFVYLDISLEVTVKPDYFRNNLRQALLRIFNDRTRPDGRRGVFHPDNFTFGQPVYLSALLAEAQAVEGVESIRALRFERQDDPASSGLASGRLEFQRLEIARLDSNPNTLKRGTFSLVLRGGK